jgi:flagellar hook-associated protein 3 FlgL
MRISTNLFHMQSFASIEKHQNSVLAIQEKLTTGQRVNRPSDDPIATSQINALNTTMNTLDQFAKNGDYAKSMLSYEETQMDSAVEATQRVRELTIQMMNETYTPEQRQAAGAEIGELIDHVTSLMNSTNSEGELLFAGSNVSADAAFVEDTVNPTTATGLSFYAYIGSANAGADYDERANFGARFVQIGFDSDDKLNPDDNGDPSRVRVTDQGGKVFNVPGATSLPAGVDTNLVNVMVQLKDYLDQGLQPPAEIGDDLQTGIKEMSKVLAEVGSRQNRIENQYDAGQEFRIALNERRSKIQDQDAVEGISEFTMKQNALQMAQQVFSRVQGMSLFDYLG